MFGYFYYKEVVNLADYISAFTGSEIDQAIGKANSINKNATEVNSALSTVDKISNSLSSLNEGELLAKKLDGTIEGTGIVNEADKIFFPKDGRFPSGSIDVGPCATISENGGWLQYTAHTMDKSYILMDYEINNQGTTRPVYWERLAEEKGIVINAGNDQILSNLLTFNHQPSTDSQVNALYLDFSSPVTNFMVEVVSVDTGKTIKYIPNETTWRKGTGGLNLLQGINNILQGKTLTPMSLLNAYHLKFNFRADTQINIKGNGNKPYLMVDRQLIISKGVLLQGEGTGSPDSPEQIRDKLQTLVGNNKLDVSALRGLEEAIISGIPILDGGTANSLFSGNINGGNANGN